MPPGYWGDSFGKARAWVLFDGATGSILTSYNIAGVQRLSAGNYNVTLAQPMPDTNYVAVATVVLSGFQMVAVQPLSVNIANVGVFDPALLQVDPQTCSVVFFR